MRFSHRIKRSLLSREGQEYLIPLFDKVTQGVTGDLLDVELASGNLMANIPSRKRRFKNQSFCYVVINCNK
jgi:hypothetical protein